MSLHRINVFCLLLLLLRVCEGSDIAATQRNRKDKTSSIHRSQKSIKSSIRTVSKSKPSIIKRRTKSADRGRLLLLPSTSSVFKNSIRYRESHRNNTNNKRNHLAKQDKRNQASQHTHTHTQSHRYTSNII